MVEVILEAGARVLGDEGLGGFTTNRVAEIAGVSIGSLYQYFPDKLSLIHGIRQRHLDDCLAALRRVRAISIPQFATDLVDALIEVHSLHPGLHRVLLDEAPSSAEHRNPASAFEQEYLGLYQAAVSLFRGGSAKVVTTSALILSDAIDGVIHNAARRGKLNDAEVRDQLIRLVSLYLADNDKQQ